jgi:hypothetical protein
MPSATLNRNTNAGGGIMTPMLCMIPVEVDYSLLHPPHSGPPPELHRYPPGPPDLRLLLHVLLEGWLLNQ